MEKECDNTLKTFRNKLINNSSNSQNFNSNEPEPSFSKKVLSDNYKKPSKAHDRNKILNKIRKFEPINISDLKRKIGNIGYSTLWCIIREFEFVNLVKTKEVVGNDNQHFRIVFIPEEEENEK